MSHKAFSSPDELEKKVNEYFKLCDSQVETFTDSKGNTKMVQKPYTITGLCVFLGISRVTLNHYSHEGGYDEIFADAKMRVENYCEENTMIGKLNPVFSIFSLKNNFNWIDQVQAISVHEPEKLSIDEIKKRLHKGDDGEE